MSYYRLKNRTNSIIYFVSIKYVNRTFKRNKNKKQEKKNISQNTKLIYGAIGILSSLVLLICMIIDLIK